MNIPKQPEFLTALKSYFEVTYDPQKPAMKLKLTKVSEERNIGGGFMAYDIVFESSKDYGGHLKQGTWKMKNETLGEIEIFISPFREKTDRYLYSAAFNYEVEEEESEELESN